MFLNFNPILLINCLDPGRLWKYDKPRSTKFHYYTSFTDIEMQRQEDNGVTSSSPSPATRTSETPPPPPPPPPSSSSISLSDRLQSWLSDVARSHSTRVPSTSCLEERRDGDGMTSYYHVDDCSRLKPNNTGNIGSRSVVEVGVQTDAGSRPPAAENGGVSRSSRTYNNRSLGPPVSDCS